MVDKTLTHPPGGTGERTGMVSVHVTMFTEDGVVSHNRTHDKVVGVTVIDGDRKLTYDYETGSVEWENETGSGTFDALEKEPVS